MPLEPGDQDPGQRQVRSLHELPDGHPDAQLFNVLQTMELPAEIYFTNDRNEQMRQVMWLLNREQLLQSWCLAQFYWNEPAPLGTFVRKYAPHLL